MTAPCHECGKREIGCHDRCAEYREFQQKRKKMTDWLREQNKVRLTHRKGGWDRVKNCFTFPK